MPITNVIGVPWENIVSIGGIPKSSITNIGGVVVPPSVTCITVYYGYSDGIRTTPEDSCLASTQPFEFDPISEILYNFGGCGTELARPGYYSDGTTIFSWLPSDESGWKWMVYSDCVTVGPVNNLPPLFSAVNTDTNQSIGSKGLWSTTGTVSYIYEWYSDDTLIFTQTSPLFLSLIHI